MTRSPFLHPVPFLFHICIDLGVAPFLFGLSPSVSIFLCMPSRRAYAAIALCCLRSSTFAIFWWGLGYRDFVVAKNLWKARFGNYWLTAAALICLGYLNIAIRTWPVRQHSGKAAVNPAGIGSESNSSWCIVNIKYMNRKGIVSFVACGKEHLFTIANTSCTVTGKFEFASLGCRILFDINWKVWPWSPASWVVELFKAEKQAGFFSHVNSSWLFFEFYFLFIYQIKQDGLDISQTLQENLIVTKFHCSCTDWQVGNFAFVCLTYVGFLLFSILLRMNQDSV